MKALVLTLALAFTGSAHAQHGAAPAAMSVPAEAAQFDFLVGQWELEVSPKVGGLAAMIHGAPKLVGSWKAWKSFDGHGIDDELRIVDASGNPRSLNHSLRIFDAKAKRWQVSGLDVYRARFGSSSGTWQGGEMRLEGSGQNAEGKPMLTRTRFMEISADRFKMRQDRSLDNGASWDEGTLTVVAKRVSRKAVR
ncbi:MULTISPECIES: hypothetical protein [unclassified Roseateles]|jgi:hypothetical protein|uniref:hypothetical protein n=1 Tax=unclassified Roseateles TaxID=2626991 RepID=UPI0006FCC0A3|nr:MULTISPECIES: hypothetical protein [unclassified Roseateles]KQW44839.1 hypothetical protein ASC81_14830 [Pelomonas sp. Root405]KRA70198.1 hypothetical protein ASD88_18990 [Pelomonas sp. Root662]